MSERIAIVGGGIIGLASAWYLARAGKRVLVLDRDRIGHGCSHGNCGLICPSHVLPLAEPGAVRQAFKAIFRPRGPLRIRPQCSRRFWVWMWQFARRCRLEPMMASARAIQPLLQSSMREYLTWVHDERIECQWHQRGLLFVYRNRRQWERFQTTNDLLQEHFGEGAEKLSDRQLWELVPTLVSTVAGGWYYHGDAHLRPDLLIQSLRRHLERQGRVEFWEGAHVQRLEGSERRLQAVVLHDGRRIEIAEVVIAAGAQSVALEGQLGTHLLVEPGKGYSVTLPEPIDGPSIPMIFPEQRVAVTPFDNGIRLGSVMEFVGFDSQIPAWRMTYLRRVAREYLRCEIGREVQERWFGWRPMTPDSVPIIDRSPRWKNAWIATGHNMLGLSMAPATGRLIAEMISGQETHLDTYPYRLNRFHRG
ncbi:MAG: amino acid dehydrogenase [Pirellulaceae bacterium]|nr:MAG: amino acid dehydrogenase [Pirellulaceae bacterium]